MFILGSTKRISNNDIVNYLMQQSPKQQLSTMGVENLFPYAGFTEENLREYYENPPAGIKIIKIYNILYMFKKYLFKFYYVYKTKKYIFC